MVHPTVQISEAMKAARERAGISQKELARRSGVASAMAEQWGNPDNYQMQETIEGW